jgi:hypothetical protein
MPSSSGVKRSEKTCLESEAAHCCTEHAVDMTIVASTMKFLKACYFDMLKSGNKQNEVRVREV